MAAYKKALSLDPQYDDAYYNLGNIYEAHMQNDLALEAYRTALKFNPKLVYARNNLGAIYDTKGLLEDAIAEYRHAIRIDPKYPYSYNNLGTSLIKKGDMDGALANYLKAVELLPGQPDFRFNLGYTLPPERQSGRRFEGISGGAQDCAWLYGGDLLCRNNLSSAGRHGKCREVMASSGGKKSKPYEGKKMFGNV